MTPHTTWNRLAGLYTIGIARYTPRIYGLRVTAIDASTQNEGGALVFVDDEVLVHLGIRPRLHSLRPHEAVDAHEDLRRRRP